MPIFIKYVNSITEKIVQGCLKDKPAIFPHVLNEHNMSGLFKLVNSIVEKNLYVCQVFVGQYYCVVYCPAGAGIIPGFLGGVTLFFPKNDFVGVLELRANSG